MFTKYRAMVIGEAYFVTITTVGRIDLFTRVRQKYVIINAIKQSMCVLIHLLNKK